MCKLKKKVLKDDPEYYIEFLNDPHYLCKEFARVANKKKNICKPIEI